MRPWLTVLATALLVATTVGCGHASKATGSRTVTSRGYDRLDGDTDEDDEHPLTAGNDDSSLFSTYGTSASPADSRVIGALVKRYFAAAAASNGAAACALLDVTLAHQLVEGEPSSGDCARALSLQLVRQHELLAADDVATMTVIYVHVKGSLGLAALGFRKAPEQQIIVEREGGEWKVDALVGSDLT